ncbi:MAG: DegT/DnrJ/EryC1/StrS family aminotransferase [Kiritimatiellae bacterium]|nr:DegT/DnrJ/EryC1/StrS family aminotransferase [Kiritimatiellia bacterium]
MKVPFLDLKTQFKTIEADVRARWEDVLANTSFILGPAVREFEQEFAGFLGCKHVVGLGSGLAALELALRTLDIGPGSAVLLPANTFIATALAVSGVGATPILIDMDPRTYNIDPAKLTRFIEQHCQDDGSALSVSNSCPLVSIRGSLPRAIMPVHLFGQPTDMDEILAIAARYGLRVIEDACQSHGARYKGRRTGTLGDMAAFSFYPGKNLGAYGDGGAVATNDDALAEQIAMCRNYGSKKKYYHEIAGTNSRLDSLQAAVLSAKLPHLDEWNAARRRHAERYAAGLADCPQVACPVTAADRDHVFHLYVVRAERRDALQAYLSEREISTGLHYPIPIHLTDAYRDLGYQEGAFPETERAAQDMLSLPMCAELTDAQVDYVCECIQAFYAGE